MRGKGVVVGPVAFFIVWGDGSAQITMTGCPCCLPGVFCHSHRMIPSPFEPGSQLKSKLLPSQGYCDCTMKRKLSLCRQYAPLRTGRMPVQRQDVQM